MTARLIALFTVSIWGLTFVSTKVLLADLLPIEILFVRFLMGFAALFALRPRRLALKRRRDEVLFALAGASGVTLYYLLENIALVYTSASHVGIIVAVAPLFTALLAHALGHEKSPQPRFIAGFIVAMGGIALVSLAGGEVEGGIAGDALAIAAALLWSVYSIVVVRISERGYETIAATRRTFFWGILFMLPLLPIMGSTPEMVGAVLQPANLGNLLFLGLGASAACFVTWSVAVQKLGASRASSFIYLVPVITTTASALIIGESVTPSMIVGIGLTIGGLALSQSNPKRATAKRR